MEFLKSSESKQNLLKISLVIPLLIFITLPLFLIAYKGYLYERGIRWEGIILPAIAIFIAVIIIYSVKVMISKLKEKGKIKRIWPATFSLCLIISFFGLSIFIWEINFYYSAAHYDTGPVLTWGSNQDPSTEITVMWRTVEPEESSVTYSTDKEFSKSSQNTVTNSESVEWHQIVISDLNPDTKYYYRIDDFDKTIYSFTTAPVSDSSFNFFIVSDLRQNSGDLGCLFGPNVPKYMADKATADGDFPEFTIATGDIVSEGTRYPTWKSWFDDISLSSRLATFAPLVDAVGNHERHDDPEGDIFAKYYPLDHRTNKQFYYSFNYSQIHFTMLDPWKIDGEESWWDEELVDEQYNWAKNDLQNAMTKTFRIICLHPPPIRNNNGDIEILLPRVLDLADNYNVSLVFYGHKHSYDYTVINGTHFLLNGVGGNLDSGDSGYSEVKVIENKLTLMQHWLNGTSHNLADITPN